MRSDEIAWPLSASIVRRALIVWLGIPHPADGSSRDLIMAEEPSALIVRRVMRRLEEIQEQVAGRLVEYIDWSPRPGQPADEERARIAGAVNSQINLAALTQDDLRGTGYDPVAVAGLIRARTASDRQLTRHLSPSGQALYESMVNASAAIFVAVARAAAPGARNVIKALAEDDYIRDRVRNALVHLPSRFHNDPEDTEQLYRTHLADSLDRVELVGFPLARRIGQEQLTATFIRPDVRLHSTPVPVDWALADQPRLFLHGPAGSGKTSILKWLAVAVARRHGDGLLAGLADTLPLYIQVRQLVPGRLSTELSELAFSQPTAALIAGRLRTRAATGSLLLLVDGLDETRPADRAPILNWLGELVRRYPECRYVVTSRNDVAEELLPPRFTPARVLPLERDGIMRLVRQWLGALTDGDPPAATKQARRLIDLIDDDGRLGELASSPLMCALITVLYTQRGNSALRGPSIHEPLAEMLAMRRDNERAIGDSGRWTYRTVRQLLMALATAMVFRGSDELAEPEVLDILEREFADRPEIHDTPAVAYEHLRTRVGLLTEPVPGRLGFVHRTFRDYLSAREVLDEKLFDKAVDHAHDPSWREVLITVAALADHGDADRFATLLLRRYRNEPARRVLLGPVTQNCLASMHWLSPEIRHEADIAWQELLPGGGSQVFIVEIPRQEGWEPLARWLRIESSTRFDEPVSVTPDEGDIIHRLLITGRPGLRLGQVVETMTEWARMNRHSVIVRDAAGTEIVIHPSQMRSRFV
ncbi:NACHT domain-containing protein [Micromonospora sp. NPDC049089]|uniref:NACHT domain-containing protein n=1 Tax=Micromonospora sp. NPDC049089 TaxID=3155496 RepID=UPI003402E8B1